MQAKLQLFVCWKHNSFFRFLLYCDLTKKQAWNYAVLTKGLWFWQGARKKMQRKFQNLRCISEMCPCIRNKKDLQKEGRRRNVLGKILQKMKEFRNLACKNAGGTGHGLAIFREKAFKMQECGIAFTRAEGARRVWNCIFRRKFL